MAKIDFIEVYLSDGSRTIINRNGEATAYDKEDNKMEKVPRIPTQILNYCAIFFATKK